METIYTVDYFIKKFTAIPEEKWTTDVFNTDDGKSCAQGHCGMTAENSTGIWNNDGTNPEAEALVALFGGRDADGRVCVVNNGTHPGYQQPTPKQRILAALYDIKAKQQPQPEPKERVVYKTVLIDEAVKNLQETLTEN